MGNIANADPPRVLESAIAAFERDAEEHVTNGPCPEQELIRLEHSIGAPLPPDFRCFLARVGGGLYFQGHEIFGTRRVMIHDIELVPDMLSMRTRLAEGGWDPLSEGLVPFHRFAEGIHLVCLRGGRGEVVALGGPGKYPDLSSFLQSVVLSRLPRNAD